MNKIFKFKVNHLAKSWKCKAVRWAAEINFGGIVAFKSGEMTKYIVNNAVKLNYPVLANP